MEFFNLGWSEILLIFLLAFIILGPGKIKEFGGELGTFLRKLGKDGLFREVVQTTDEIRNYPRKILNEAMLDKPVLYDEAKDRMIHSPQQIIDVEPEAYQAPHSESQPTDSAQ